MVSHFVLYHLGTHFTESSWTYTIIQLAILLISITTSAMICQVFDSKIGYFYGSPIPSFLIVSIYCYFCIKRGKKMMEKREPMTLKMTMILYNIVQVLANLYVVVISFKAMSTYWFSGGNLRCLIKNENYNTNLSYSQYNQFVEEVDHLTYVYALIKFSDLLDTVFMVFKKNFHQISFLHVYHHAMMAVTVIFLYKFFNRTFDLYTGTSNAFIHVVMYSYYLASVYNPEIKKSLTLKKSITLMQLSQFIFTFFITVYMSTDSGCRISNFLSVYFLFQTFMMITLFSNFFYRTYIKKKPKKEEKIKEH